MRFKNLLRTSDDQLNQLSEDEKEMIWLPYTVFFNIESKKKIEKSDKKDVLKIVPNEGFYHTYADKVRAR